MRSPKQGFDSRVSFTPGPTYALVDAHTAQKVLQGAPVAWNGGVVDGSSGDLAFWFDFSRVTTAGDYFVLDEAQEVRSDVFTISDTVYRDVLAQAMRMLCYQRDGFAKDVQHAGAAYVDGAAHLGQCYLYSDASKTQDRDLQGGWWDAGDFNKYTSWGAEDVIELLRAYEEATAAFRDDYNIPESGNGVPNVLDEVKWELDWLARMQNADGSVQSIVNEAAARSPRLGGSRDTSPSKVTDPCFYRPATTAVSYAAAAPFACAARILRSAPGVGAAYPGYAEDLAGRARQAWAWAQAHGGPTPSTSTTRGTASAQASRKVGAAGLPFKLLEAALYLFQLTGAPPTAAPSTGATALSSSSGAAPRTPTTAPSRRCSSRVRRRSAPPPPSPEDQGRLHVRGAERRQPGERAEGPVPGLPRLVHVGVEPGEGGPRQPVPRPRHLRGRSREPGRRPGRRALRPLPSRSEPARARVPLQHGRPRGGQERAPHVPRVVRRGLPLGRGGHLPIPARPPATSSEGPTPATPGMAVAPAGAAGSTAARPRPRHRPGSRPRSHTRTSTPSGPSTPGRSASRPTVTR